ncbi:hypothetical protein B0H17DRAFT_1241192, partial [Mycena rosella]
EKFWINHQSFLQSRGYLLRPRYRSGWVPSWTLPDANFDPEQSNIYEFKRDNVLDAIRVSDGSKVILKRVRTWTDEIRLGVYFSSEKLLQDPHNRTYHLLDVIPLSDDDAFAIIVMPFLREFDSPVFRYLSDIVDAMRSYCFPESTKTIAQGFKFMHAHNVAHRDACALNLMMDCTRVIPQSFHFSAPWTQDGVNYGVQSRQWIITSLISASPERTRVLGVFGQDKTVPELSDIVPYNPFKVDIYQLGNVFSELITVASCSSLCHALF